MYRTLKTTDKPAASSGQSDGSGEEDFADLSFRRLLEQRVSDGIKTTRDLDFPSTIANTAITSKVARAQPSSGDTDGATPAEFSHESNDPYDGSNHNVSQVPHRQEVRNPSLEFTLGRPDWHGPAGDI